MRLSQLLRTSLCLGSLQQILTKFPYKKNLSGSYHTPLKPILSHCSSFYSISLVVFFLESYLLRSSLMEGLGLLGSQLPPGFRFHPTDQELIIHYLMKRVMSSLTPATSIIAEIDLYKFNPWELPGIKISDCSFTSSNFLILYFVLSYLEIFFKKAK